MAWILESRFFRRIADTWLTISVHLDAFCAEPRAYFIAVKWRIKRKRVRARAQFARLMSLSPRAYMLWAMRDERNGREASPPDPSKPILVLVNVAGNPDPEAIAVTMDSIGREGLEALLIGSMQTPTLGDAAAAIHSIDKTWLLPIDAGDTLATGAAAAYREAMDGYSGHLIYADDDVLRGRWRSNPNFKPDWNSELFEHWDFLAGACILRASQHDLDAISDKVSWQHNLVAQVARRGGPLHLRQMLHHRHRRPRQSLPPQPFKTGVDLPPVSVIIPTRNRVDLLHTCLGGLAAASYPDIEVIVMDNGSDDPETLTYLAALDTRRYRIVRHDGPFNYSAINNRGVGLARGRLICLLNNDIETTDTHWLSILATQALRPDVGAVGARLLYPDGRIQHAGVVIGVGNAAGHAHRFLRPDEEGYFHRHGLPQFTMAVTAACLVVERDKFMAAGGLNEVDFPVAFNDVDLCLRLNERGWQSLYEPRATLIHHESVSRGLDIDPVGAARFASELAALKRIWKTDKRIDPYHHPYLSRACEQFVVSL